MTGAQYDYYVDRFVMTGAIVALFTLTSGGTIAICASIAVWTQYVLVDQFLCNQFLRLARWSPDELWLDDEGAWKVNWSPIAKLGGNLPMVLLAAGTLASTGAATLSAVILIAMRIPTYHMLKRKIAQREKRIAALESAAQGPPSQSMTVEPFLEHDPGESNVPSNAETR